MLHHSRDRYAEKKKEIGEQADRLLKDMDKLSKDRKEAVKANYWRDSKAQKYRRSENAFKRDVMFLDDQYKKLEYAYKNGGANPLLYFGKVTIGFLGSIVSLFWFIHILIYVLPVTVRAQPLGPFLNDFFDKTFQAPIFGIVFYGIFVFWLLACVIKGLVKLGVRFVFFTIYPIK